MGVIKKEPGFKVTGEKLSNYFEKDLFFKVGFRKALYDTPVNRAKDR